MYGRKKSLLCAVLLTVILTTACASGPPSTQPSQAPSEAASAQPTSAQPVVTPSQSASSLPKSDVSAAPPSQPANALPQSDQPFTYDDVLTLIPEGSTIGDVIELVRAQYVSWDYFGEATGESSLTLIFSDSYIELIIYAPEGSELEESTRELQPLESLPPELLEEEAIVIGALWFEPQFQLPTVRGVGLGASEDDVLRAFLCEDASGDIIYGINALNPDADESWASEFVGARRYVNEYTDEIIPGLEYVYSDVTEEDEWRMYYRLVYYTENGTVTSIQLTYHTDPE